MDVETKYILVLLCTCFTLAQAINDKLIKIYKVTELILFGNKMPFFILIINYVPKYSKSLIQMMCCKLFT